MADNHLFKLGIVGARGYVGSELIQLIEAHPNFELAFAASRSDAGQPVPDAPLISYIDAAPETVAQQDVDALILAVPDGATEAYCNSNNAPIILDLSSDHRFDDSWTYGLSELNSDAIRTAKHISNPGCYATALQLLAAPIRQLTSSPIHAFGVSGYSGAGTTPSDRNNPEMLKDGVTPYKIVGHTHERECSRHLNHAIRFSPHVAPYFRGITLTLQAELNSPSSLDAIETLYHQQYDGHDLINVINELTPRVQDIANQPGAILGAFTLSEDKTKFAAVSVIDNLLKGAASQAIQNLNLALGLEMNTGLQAGALT